MVRRLVDRMKKEFESLRIRIVRLRALERCRRARLATRPGSRRARAGRLRRSLRWDVAGRTRDSPRPSPAARTRSLGGVAAPAVRSYAFDLPVSADRHGRVRICSLFLTLDQRFTSFASSNGQRQTDGHPEYNAGVYSGAHCDDCSRHRQTDRRVHRSPRAR